LDTPWYCCGIKSRNLQWAGYAEGMRELRSTCLTFLSEVLNRRDHFKDEGVYEGNIKVELKEIRYEDVGWIHLA
jgi:hypothetical protein